MDIAQIINQNLFSLNLLLVVGFAILLHVLINLMIRRLYKLFDIKRKDNLKQRKVHTQLIFIQRILKGIVWVIAFGIILLSIKEFNQYGKSLLTSAGILSVVVGFAAQKSLANLIAGFQIAFTQPIRIDDAVVIENEWGWIEEITLTYVVVRIWDKRRLILPITYIIEKPIQNWTRTTAQIIGTVHFFVHYSVNVEKLREEFKRILQEQPLWDGEVQTLQVVELREQSIEMRALMSAANSSDAWDLRCLMREKLLAYLSKNNLRPVFTHGSHFSLLDEKNQGSVS